jgi:para-nitrobenzyl esterase
MSDPVVTTVTGAVRGRAHSRYSEYLGIPYAAPPAGVARFYEPQPHAPWGGVRDATRPGPAAPQAPRKGFGNLDMTPYFGHPVPGDADYLTLNVWAPRDAAACPVMVFVHGGGFVSGTTHSRLYNGAAFARDGVVLVTVTYRLGIAGFLDLPDAPANRGLLDVVSALEWVQANIAGFGGDPGNVTLFGQSAGATIVGAIVAMAGASRLVTRAIIQSGNGFGAFSREQAARVAHRVTTLLSAEATVAGLADVADSHLVEIASRTTGLDLNTAERPDPLVGLSAFGLVLDDQPADTVAAGTGADIPLLIGTNSEEGNLYLAPTGALRDSTEKDVYELAAQTHTDPGALVADYRTRMPTATWGQLRSAMLGDALFGRGTERLAQAHAAHGLAATHRYLFSWRSTAIDGLLGAAHTVELPFVFDRVDLAELHGPRGLLGGGNPPAHLADQVHGAWVAYAHDGDPGWDPARLHHFPATPD